MKKIQKYESFQISFSYSVNIETHSFLKYWRKGDFKKWGPKRKRKEGQLKKSCGEEKILDLKFFIVYNKFI